MRALRRLMRWFLQALVRLYYPVQTVEGRARVPAAGPLIFVLNHPNALLDPMILRVALDRPVRFLGKSTLFENPVGRLAMQAFATIPVFRAHESGARAGDPSRNEETFARCREALGKGHALALFPEGRSHSETTLQPMKTGAARIALSAEHEHEGGLGLAVVPVGLLYEEKAVFRSAVHLVVGQPMPVAPRLPAYRADERAAVAALTEDIRRALDEVVLQAETREVLDGVARVASWTDPGAADDPEARRRLARRLLDAWMALRASDAPRAEALADEMRAYTRTLRRVGVPDPWALELGGPRSGRVVARAAGLMLAAPVAWLGAALGWIPYRLAGRVAARVARDEDLLGTVKLVAGLTFLLVAWGAEAVVAARFGVATGVAVFLAGPTAGYVALRWDEAAADLAVDVRTVWLRERRAPIAQRLADQRRRIADRVAQTLEEVTGGGLAAAGRVLAPGVEVG